ncbi:MAG TPA: polyprenyl synthetase family protein [Anaerolineae bacterium]|nr:polyprenyl synthetase family protein [Anaerolineae bacterium]
MTQRHLEMMDLVQEDLQRVEGTLRVLPMIDYEVVEEAIGHLLGSGGKRIRPTLTLLTSRLYPADLDKVVSLAAAVEMLHTATLVHDDLIDSSLMRRGSPTLNAIWTPGTTILVGDYLFARAAGLAAQTDNVRVMQIFARTLMTIVTGELGQMFDDGRPVSREAYERRIYAKTASMFELATEAAGVLIHAPEDQIGVLRDFGRDLGMAFQIVDDVLDFTGDPVEVGKPVGSDLRRGVVTLPVLHFLENHPDDRRIADALSNGQRDERHIGDIVESIRASDSIGASLGDAREYTRRSQRALSYLPEGSARQAMWDIAEYVITRTR